jgi:ATP-dependent DNA helicase RecG
MKESAPLGELRGVGPRRAELLRKLGLRSVGDLLRHFPSRYLDRRAVTALGALRAGETAVVQATVVRVRGYRSTRKRVAVVEATVESGRRRAALVWFNQPWRAKEFSAGDVVVASGRVQEGGARIAVEDCEVLEPGAAPEGIVPCYPALEGLGPRTMRALVRAALEAVEEPADPIPAELRERRRLLAAREAFRAVHRPASPEEAEEARRRFAYEEFLALQLRCALRRRAAGRERAARLLPVDRTLDFRIRARFPFRLTGAQERAVAAIRRDLQAGPPMRRLLQGDVGSGKTIIAAYALLAAVGNRAQAAIMAPTEILAEQHAATFSRLLAGSRVRIGVLSGRVSGRARAELLGRAAAGELDLLVGTHALVEEGVRFRDLALAVIDEQQKFGVLQRAALGEKGARPHVLVMTATPIPRTLALTLYGDLDLTVLDELPPGRREVTTLHVPPAGRREKIEFVRRKLKEGRQAYFVYPLVDESDRTALRSAVAMHAELSREFAGFETALLHGRMRPEQKEVAMEAFRTGKARVLVTTLVVEVGVDVPNASIMVIDHAERHGLSQLHQLRGRIGRGPHESTCILFGEPNERIAAFVATNDGFKVAEADLRLRGPGELMGVRQSGLPLLRAARLPGDAPLLDRAREDAFALAAGDPSRAEALAGEGGPAGLLSVG